MVEYLLLADTDVTEGIINTAGRINKRVAENKDFTLFEFVHGTTPLYELIEQLKQHQDYIFLTKPEYTKLLKYQQHETICISRIIRVRRREYGMGRR